MFLFLLDIPLAVKLLCQKTLVYFVRNCQTVFQAAAPFYIHTSNIQSQFPHILTNTSYHLSHHPSGCEAVLTCISLMNNVAHLSCTYWTLSYLFWRNVNLDPLPIFKLGFPLFYDRVVTVLCMF